MHFSTLAILAGLAITVHAHFQLQFPAARGPFVEDDEPNFCDGFDEAVSNRTTFPLDNGYFTFNSEHTSWSMGVLLSTVQNPTSFDNFSKTPVKPFFKSGGEGMFCIPIDLGVAGVSGVADGANVTLQFEFDGGDGNLFQCADLTLSKTAIIPSNVTCTNATNSSVTQSASASSTSPASTQHAGVDHALDVPVFATMFLGLASIALSFF